MCGNIFNLKKLEEEKNGSVALLRKKNQNKSGGRMFSTDGLLSEVLVVGVNLLCVFSLSDSPSCTMVASASGLKAHGEILTRSFFSFFSFFIFID